MGGMKPGIRPKGMASDRDGAPAIICFTRAARELAQTIANGVEGQVLFLGEAADRAGQLQALFAQNRPLIGVCATGILVRLLAPALSDKHEEPPVIAVSGNGAYVVPVLGGHRGANVLAEKIARITGGSAAITTASENRFSFALDEPPAGYVLASPDRAKAAMAALLNGEDLSVLGESDWLENAGYPVNPQGSVRVVVSEKTAPKDVLTFHPATLVAGVGCARGTGAQEIISLVEKSLLRAGLAPESLAALASIDLKADETGLHGAAEHFNVPLRFFDARKLAEIARDAPNPSKAVLRETGTPSVAEACALLAGELLVQKQKTANATCAIARAPKPLDISEFGRAQGAVHLVGIGPGEAEQRTFSAKRALQACNHWVGYGLYLDLVADLHQGQEQHRFDLGDEEVRVRHAMELAGRGENVALICSGDAQIYAMASLVFELLEAKGTRALSDGARRIAVESHPGISALQMASARAGALLGHDFCAVSLSDLLTPRPHIEKRLQAAATGDFVTALYNPRSRRRTDLLEKARTLFLAHRPPGTPVILASNLGRTGERVKILTLETFDPQDVDMLTIVLFGSSASRSFVRGDGNDVAYTPRGYAAKRGTA